MDLENIPLSITSASPFIILVAMQRNGMGRLLKSIGSEYPTDKELKRLIRLSPETIPVGNEFLKDWFCSSSLSELVEKGNVMT